MFFISMYTLNFCALPHLFRWRSNNIDAFYAFFTFPDIFSIREFLQPSKHTVEFLLETCLVI